MVCLNSSSKDQTYYSYKGEASNVPSCASYLMLGIEDWRVASYGKNEKFAIRGTDLKPLPTEDTYFVIDVTNIANAWRQGTLPNYGFVLRGPYEYPIDMPVIINGDDRYHCASVYDNFRLEVTYFTE